MNFPQNMLNIIIGLSIVVGAVQCFFGYRIFKFVMGLTGFLAGGVLSSGFGYTLSQNELVALLAGIVGGFIGAAVLVALYFIGVFFIGALLGGIVGAIIFSVSGSEPIPVIILTIAIISGVMALVFQKLMIIVSTGFGGAWGIVAGTAYFTIGAIDPIIMERMFRPGDSRYYVFLLCWIALGIIGVFVQYRFIPQNDGET